MEIDTILREAIENAVPWYQTKLRLHTMNAPIVNKFTNGETNTLFESSFFRRADEIQ